MPFTPTDFRKAMARFTTSSFEGWDKWSVQRTFNQF